MTKNAVRPMSRRGWMHSVVLRKSAAPPRKPQNFNVRKMSAAALKMSACAVLAFACRSVPLDFARSPKRRRLALLLLRRHSLSRHPLMQPPGRQVRVPEAAPAFGPVVELVFVPVAERARVHVPEVVQVTRARVARVLVDSTANARVADLAPVAVVVTRARAANVLVDTRVRVDLAPVGTRGRAVPVPVDLIVIARVAVLVPLAVVVTRGKAVHVPVDTRARVARDLVDIKVRPGNVQLVIRGSSVGIRASAGPVGRADQVGTRASVAPAERAAHHAAIGLISPDRKAEVTDAAKMADVAPHQPSYQKAICRRLVLCGSTSRRAAHVATANLQPQPTRSGAR